MSFTENLYLKRMIQQLHEENLKLKSLINEAFEYLHPTPKPKLPTKRPGLDPTQPGVPVAPMPRPIIPGPDIDPKIRPKQRPTIPGPSRDVDPGFHLKPRNPIRVPSHTPGLGFDDLHPNNPLRVDDADTGSAAHPGEEGAVDDMPTNPFRVSGTYTSTYTSSQNHPKPTFGHPTTPKFVDLDNPNYPKRGR